MPKYIFDLEKNLDFQGSLSRKLTDVCEITDCEYCKYSLLCIFNIKTTTQLILLKRE